MLSTIKTTYKVQDQSYCWLFEKTENGYSILGQRATKYLQFENSKLKCLKSFHQALGEFITLMENLSK